MADSDEIQFEYEKIYESLSNVGDLINAKDTDYVYSSTELLDAIIEQLDQVASIASGRLGKRNPLD